MGKKKFETNEQRLVEIERLTNELMLTTDEIQKTKIKAKLKYWKNYENIQIYRRSYYENKEKVKRASVQIENYASKIQNLSKKLKNITNVEEKK